MGLRIDGADFSNWQKGVPVDWAVAKRNGLGFLYHKATEGHPGSLYEDGAYNYRREQARHAGVIFGAYHFAHPAVGMGKADAQAFLAFAKPRPGDLLPALDLEENPNNLTEAQLTAYVNSFFAEVFRVMGFNGGVLYTHYNLGPLVKGLYLWVPRYSNSNMAPVVPNPWGRWHIWQFSDGVYGNPNRLPGIGGGTDLNTMNRFRGITPQRLRIPTPKPRKPAPKPAPKPVPAKPVVDRHPVITDAKNDILQAEKNNANNPSILARLKAAYNALKGI